MFYKYDSDDEEVEEEDDIEVCDDNDILWVLTLSIQ